MAEVRLGEVASIMGLSLRASSFSTIFFCFCFSSAASRNDLFDCFWILPERSFELANERFPNILTEEKNRNERQRHLERVDRLVDAGCENEGPPEVLRFRAFREKGTTSKKLGVYLARSVKIPHTDCQVVACRVGRNERKMLGRPVFIHSLAKLHPLPPSTKPQPTGRCSTRHSSSWKRHPIPVVHKHQAARQHYQQPTTLEVHGSPCLFC